MNGLLAGKSILISGVLTPTSIAFDVARQVQSEGGRVLLTGFGRRRRLTESSARRLSVPAPVLEFDAESHADIGGLAHQVREHAAGLDGVVHCISASSPTVVGDHFMTASWEDVAHSMRVSAYSYQALVQAVMPVMNSGAGIVGCTLDASVAWPVYGWAGVAKSAYEATNRYLAYHLGSRGIRSNLVAAGPVKSATMRGIDGIDGIDELWEGRASLPWAPNARASVATTITTLLSDYLPGVTGEIIHCDGGFHARGY